MVPDLACFASFLEHDHESVHKKDVFCGIKRANHRFLAKNIFAMLEKDDPQKGANLRKKNVRHAHILPLCPRGQPPGMAADKCISKGASQQVRKDSFS